jgi:MurNAc alpha-1-phosphate uridylyltransferase
MGYKMIQQHELNALAHLWLVANPAHNVTGDFVLVDGQAQEKQNETDTALTFSGVSILHKTLFAGDHNGAFKLAPLLKQAMSAQRVSAEQYTGYWLDVGTVERLAELEAHLQPGVDNE